MKEDGFSTSHDSLALVLTIIDVLIIAITHLNYRALTYSIEPCGTPNFTRYEGKQSKPVLITCLLLINATL